MEGKYFSLKVALARLAVAEEEGKRDNDSCVPEQGMKRLVL